MRNSVGQMETEMGMSNSIFLLGAGFTKAVYPNAPLNAELAEAIISNGGKIVAKYRDKYHTGDIELLLTRLDLEAISSEEIKGERSKIESEISSYFSQFRYPNLNSETPDWLRIFANNILREHDSIITLNYDCFLEGALDSFRVWSPNGGYARVQNPLAASITENPKNIKIYKIHGSENFVKSRVDLGKRSQTAIGYQIDGSIFPVSGEHSCFGGGADHPKPYIIAPSFVKIPHVDMAAMMLDMLNVAETARNFVIIGCGMRPEDSYLWLLMTRFINKITDKPYRLILLGPSSGETCKRISEYWVGDIRRYCDILLIPSGLADGIFTLESALKNN